MVEASAGGSEGASMAPRMGASSTYLIASRHCRANKQFGTAGSQYGVGHVLLDLIFFLPFFTFHLGKHVRANIKKIYGEKMSTSR